jgi:hypothetical protein
MPNKKFQAHLKEAEANEKEAIAAREQFEKVTTKEDRFAQAEKASEAFERAGKERQAAATELAGEANKTAAEAGQEETAGDSEDELAKKAKNQVDRDFYQHNADQHYKKWKILSDEAATLCRDTAAEYGRAAEDYESAAKMDEYSMVNAPTPKRHDEEKAEFLAEYVTAADLRHKEGDWLVAAADYEVNGGKTRADHKKAADAYEKARLDRHKPIVDGFPQYTRDQGAKADEEGDLRDREEQEAK